MYQKSVQLYYRAKPYAAEQDLCSITASAAALCSQNLGHCWVWHYKNGFGGVTLALAWLMLDQG